MALRVLEHVADASLDELLDEVSAGLRCALALCLGKRHAAKEGVGEEAVADAVPGPESIHPLEGRGCLLLLPGGPGVVVLPVDDDAVLADVALFGAKRFLTPGVVLDAHTSQLDDPELVALLHGVSLFFSGLLVPGQRETRGGLLHSQHVLTRTHSKILCQSLFPHEPTDDG